MPSITLTTSRRPVSSTPMATRTLTISHTAAPCAPVAARRPRTDTGTNVPTAGCVIRRSARTPFLSLSESVCEGMRSLHSNRLMSCQPGGSRRRPGTCRSAPPRRSAPATRSGRPTPTRKRTLQLRDHEGHGPGLHRQVTLAMTRPARPAFAGPLVHLVGLHV